MTTGMDSDCRLAIANCMRGVAYHVTYKVSWYRALICCQAQGRAALTKWSDDLVNERMVQDRSV